MEKQKKDVAVVGCSPLSTDPGIGPVSMGNLFENSVFQTLRLKGELNYYQRKSGADPDLKVITFDYQGEEKIENKKIKFIPLWKWLVDIKV